MIVELVTAAPEIRLTAYTFEQAYHAAPAGVWRAPGVLVLLGGTETGGTALAVGLPWGVIVAARPRTDRAVGLYSMNFHAERCTVSLHDVRPEGVPGWAAPAVGALIAAGRPGGVDFVINSELPAETGLLTGSETQCAAGLALRDLFDADEPQTDAPDLLAARWVRPGRAVLVAGGQVGELPCDLAAAGLRLLIIDVGAATEATGAFAGSAGDVARAADALRAGDLTRLGPMLTSAHQRDGCIVDLALAVALEAGALGGRMIGRCGVLLVPMAAISAIRSRVIDRLAGVTRRPPRFLTAVPAPGAHRAG